MISILISIATIAIAATCIKNDKIADVIGYIEFFILIQAFVVPLIMGSAPVVQKTNDWVTIYQTGDDRRITLQPWIGDMSTAEVGKSYKYIERYHRGKITIEDNGSHGQYLIEVKPENIIENKKLNENSKLIKVEYRRYESQHRELFGFSGKDAPIDYDGELRLTFDDGDADIKKIFKH